jgi:hypothetical protein
VSHMRGLEYMYSIEFCRKSKSIYLESYNSTANDWW